MTSTIDLKAIAPNANNKPYSSLEYVPSDPLNGNRPTITWWEGKHYDDCESRYEIVLTQARQKKFEIPGISYKFIVVSGTIYYRKNVE